MSAADDPRWAEDPSPSWDDHGLGHLIADDTPECLGGDILAVTEKLWPDVHPIFPGRTVRVGPGGVAVWRLLCGPPNSRL